MLGDVADGKLVNTHCYTGHSSAAAAAAVTAQTTVQLGTLETAPHQQYNPV